MANFKIIDHEELQRSYPSAHLLRDILIKNGISLGFECSDSKVLLGILLKHNGLQDSEHFEIRNSLRRASDENTVLHIVSYALSIGLNFYYEARIRIVQIKQKLLGSNYCIDARYYDLSNLTEDERLLYYQAHSKYGFQYNKQGDLMPQIYNTELDNCDRNDLLEIDCQTGKK